MGLVRIVINITHFLFIFHREPNRSMFSVSEIQRRTLAMLLLFYGKPFHTFTWATQSAKLKYVVLLKFTLPANYADSYLFLRTFSTIVFLQGLDSVCAFLHKDHVVWLLLIILSFAVSRTSAIIDSGNSFLCNKTLISFFSSCSQASDWIYRRLRSVALLYIQACR